MATSIHDLCLEWHSSASAPDRDLGIRDDVALLCCLVRFALFFEQRRSLRQPLPKLGHLGLPPKLLRRFLRGFVVATTHGLVAAPASVYDVVEKNLFLRNRIFARVMSGFVLREEVLLQAAAAARIAGKSGVIAAAKSGHVADVLSYLIADANCVNERDKM
jgi:hypothetical protein